MLRRNFTRPEGATKNKIKIKINKTYIGSFKILNIFHNGFVYVKLHLQHVRQKFAHGEQVGLYFGHMKHIRDGNSMLYLFILTSTTRDKIPMASATLSSPKRILRGESTL